MEDNQQLLRSSKYDPDVKQYAHVWDRNIRDAIQNYLYNYGIRGGRDLKFGLQSKRNMMRVKTDDMTLTEDQKRQVETFTVDGKCFLHYSTSENTLYILSVSNKLKMSFCWKKNCDVNTTSTTTDDTHLTCIQHAEEENCHQELQLTDPFNINILSQNFGATIEAWKQHAKVLVERYNNLEFVQTWEIKKALQEYMSTYGRIGKSSLFNIDQLDPEILAELKDVLEDGVCQCNEFVKISVCPESGKILVKFPDMKDWQQLCSNSDCFSLALEGTDTCRSHTKKDVALSLVKDKLCEIADISDLSELTLEKMKVIINELKKRDNRRIIVQDTGSYIYLAQDEKEFKINLYNYNGTMTVKCLCRNFWESEKGCNRLTTKRAHGNYCSECHSKIVYHRAALLYFFGRNTYFTINYSVAKTAKREDKEDRKKISSYTTRYWPELGKDFEIVKQTDKLTTLEEAKGYRLALTLYAAIEGHYFQQDFKIANQHVDLSETAWKYLALILSKQNLKLELWADPYKKPLPDTERIFVFTDTPDGISMSIYRLGRYDVPIDMYFGEYNPPAREYQSGIFRSCGKHHDENDTTAARQLPNDHRRKPAETIANLKDAEFGLKQLETLFILAAHCAQHLHNSDKIKLLNYKTSSFHFPNMRKWFPEFNRIMYRLFGLTIDVVPVEKGRPKQLLTAHLNDVNRE